MACWPHSASSLLPRCTKWVALSAMWSLHGDPTIPVHPVPTSSEQHHLEDHRQTPLKLWSKSTLPLLRMVYLRCSSQWWKCKHWSLPRQTLSSGMRKATDDAEGEELGSHGDVSRRAFRTYSRHQGITQDPYSGHQLSASGMLIVASLYSAFIQELLWATILDSPGLSHDQQNLCLTESTCFFTCFSDKLIHLISEKSPQFWSGNSTEMFLIYFLCAFHEYLKGTHKYNL